ncbi:hypothetical protein MMC07_001423 [Pseudocyphellaria aurata]|nr:hypothetical protein [Pseudocyphellaria aurata]
MRVASLTTVRTRSQSSAAKDQSQLSEIKPDVVAPDSMILSAASSLRAENDNTYGSGPISEWSFMSGTSMAAPLVSGCIICICERLRKECMEAHPQCHLIQAILINGATHLQGQLRAAQGFSRVIMVGSQPLTDQSAYQLSWSKEPKGIDNYKQRPRYPLAERLRAVFSDTAARRVPRCAGKGYSKDCNPENDNGPHRSAGRGVTDRLEPRSQIQSQRQIGILAW